jgi:hypothetical protein
MAMRKSDKQGGKDDEQRRGPEMLGEAGQVAGSGRDKGFGGARGGGTGTTETGVGTLPGGAAEGHEGPSVEGTGSAESAAR